MKECTLQEACNLTKKQGGVFWGKEIIEPYKYHYDENLNYWLDEKEDRFYLEGEDFDRVWIYEPPKKSAFQEWCEDHEGAIIQESWKNARLEGWRGLGNELLKSAEKDSHDYVTISTIKQFMEL